MTKNVNNDQGDVNNCGTVKIKIELLGSGSLGLLNVEHNNRFNGMAKKLSQIIRYLVWPVEQSVCYLL